MKSLSHYGLAAIAATAVLVAGAATAQGQGSHGAHAGTHGTMDMRAMMKKNDEAMASMPSTGDVDVDFAAMMKIHHEGAIEMAQHQLRHGKDARMKAMAREIIAAQKKEIAVFDRFLAARGHAPGK